MVFDAASSRKALQRRKRRFSRVTVSDKDATRAAQHREKQARAAEKKLHATVGKLVTCWRGNVISGGTNNAVSCAGMAVLAKKLNYLRPFSAKNSVFLDVGSGCGIPCIFLALKYPRMRCIGVERSEDLVKIARSYAASVGLSARQCTFYCRNAMGLLSHFYREEGVTHVLCFDACFGVPALETVYSRLALTTNGIVGCSTVKTRQIWSQFVEKRGRPTDRIKMVGRGASTFKFGCWRVQ
jgi:tRNA G46 methylase TrmB